MLSCNLQIEQDHLGGKQMGKEDISKIFQNCDAMTGKLKLVFWVGAGIDIDAPTNLPAGNALTFFLLRKSCANDEIATSKIPDYDILKPIYGNNPRLETVIECFRTFDRYQEDHKSFLEGLKSFWEVEPNVIHYWIATLLLNGANVVTTNFDQCIPKAYKTICNQEDELSQNDYKNCAGYYQFSSKSNRAQTGTVYYIHGIANNIMTLGASLSQLAPGLPEPFQNLLEFWLKSGYTFIF